MKRTCEEKQWLAESFTIKRGCGDNVLLSQPFLSNLTISKGTGIICEMSYQDYVNSLVPFLIV
ncbi:hypothetical protein CYK02_02330 [Proteus mirabilis]|nr:hypothetical protein CYK02_02330 [Proteus mirabilis]